MSFVPFEDGKDPRGFSPQGLLTKAVAAGLMGTVLIGALHATPARELADTVSTQEAVDLAQKAEPRQVEEVNLITINGPIIYCGQTPSSASALSRVSSWLLKRTDTGKYLCDEVEPSMFQALEDISGNQNIPQAAFERPITKQEMKGLIEAKSVYEAMKGLSDSKDNLFAQNSDGSMYLNRVGHLVQEAAQRAKWAQGTFKVSTDDAAQYAMDLTQEYIKIHVFDAAYSHMSQPKTDSAVAKAIYSTVEDAHNLKQSLIIP